MKLTFQLRTKEYRLKHDSENFISLTDCYKELNY